MSSQFYISGQLGRAIYGDGGKYYVVTVENPSRSFECRPQDLSTFFRYGAEFVALHDARPDGVADALKSRTKSHRALSLVVSGLDGELDNDTRALAIEASEELLREGQVHDFVRARLLARPVPDGADLEGAGLLAEYKKSTAVKSLYDDMLGARDAISALLESWREIALEHFASRDEQEVAERLFIDLGFFSDVALAISHGDYNHLNNRIVTHGVNPEIKARFPQVMHALNALRSALAKKGAFKTEKTVGAEREELTANRGQEGPRASGLFNELRKAFGRGRDKKRSRRFRATEAKEKVDHQIEAIEEQIRRGNLNRAERYLQDLIRFQVTHSEREHLAMSLCSLAKTAIDSNAHEIAETMLGYAFSLGINDVVIWNTRAELFKAMGLLPQALSSYDEAVELFPENVVTRNGRAEVLREMGRPADALAAYEETIRLFPEDAFSRNGRAEVLREMGRLDEALQVYDEAARLFPRDAVTRSGRAEMLREVGRLGDALAAYDEAVELFPEDAFLRNGRAEVLREMGRFADALAAYDEVARLFPRDAVTRSGRAEVLREMGRLGDALAAYDEVARLFPRDAVARSARAEVLKEMGRLDEALAAYDEAARISPRDVFARSGRAEVLREMGRFADALAAYDEAARLFPQNTVVRNGHANILMLLDRVDEARALLTIEQPSSYQDWIGYHILAMSYIKTKEIDEAVSRLTYGLNNNPWARGKAYYENALGVARIRLSQFAEAEEVLKTNIVSLDAFQKQKRLALLGHAQAAGGKRVEAAASLASIGHTANRHLKTLRGDLIVRFDVPVTTETVIPTDEADAPDHAALDRRIEEEEFYIAMAA